MRPHHLVGRDRDVAAVRAVLTDAVAGAFGAVLVTGDAGIGKSALLRRVVADAVEAGFFAAVGHCSPVSSGVRFAPLRKVVRELTAPGSKKDVGIRLDQRLAPSPQSEDLDDIEALIAEVVEVAEGTPLLLAIEDLHWSDRSTIDFVHHAARTVRDARVVLLATVRTEAGELHGAHRHAFVEVQRLATVTRRHLGGLTPLDVRRLGPLVARRHLSEQEVGLLVAATGGNALLVTELLRVPPSEWGARSTTVSDIVHAGLDAVPPGSRRTLAIASCTPLDVDPVLVAALAGSTDQDVVADLHEGVVAGVLEHDGARYRFTHALFATAAHDDLSPDAATALHARLAEALESQGVAAGELAHHLELAGRPRAAFEVVLRAAKESAGPFGSIEAVAYYERALRLVTHEAVSGHVGAAALGLAETALECAFYVGDTAAAERFSQVALACCDPDADRDRWIVLHCRASELAWQNGATERSLELLAAAEGGLQETTRHATRAHVVERRAFHASMSGNGAESLRLAEEARELARADGDLTLEIEAQLRVGLAQSMKGDLDLGVGTLRDARRRAADAGHHRSVIRATINLTALHVGSGELGTALAEAATGADLALRLGAPMAWQTHAVAWHITAHVAAGNLDQASYLYREAISPPAASFTGVLDIAGAELALAAGDLGEAAGLASRVQIEPQDHLGWWLRRELVRHSVAAARGDATDRQGIDFAIDLAEFWPDSLLLQLCAAALAGADRSDRARLDRLRSRARSRADTLGRIGRSVDAEAWWHLVEGRYVEALGGAPGEQYAAAADGFAACGRPNEEGWALIAACRHGAPGATHAAIAERFERRSTRPPAALVDALADLATPLAAMPRPVAPTRGPAADGAIVFQGFELDPVRFELRHAGRVIPLEPQVLQLLLFMARHQGELLTKQRLLDEIWGDRFVSESALTTRIKTARRALGDDGTRQRFIRTVHRRGYRFVAFES